MATYGGPITIPPAGEPTPKLTIEQLRFAGAVEFGSRALGVESKGGLSGSSDYDFAMLRTNFDKLILNDTTTDIRPGKITDYFTVVPAFSKCSIVVTYTKGKTDILLFEKQSHVDVIAKSIEDMKELPRYMYTNKKDRIRLYQEALLRNGFVYSDIKARLQYLPIRALNQLKRLTKWALN